MSYPLPDRVTVNGYLLPGHFQENFQDQIPLEEKVNSFAKGLAEAHVFLTDKGPFMGKGSLLARVQLPLGGRKSRVFIEVRKVQEEGGTGFKMRMEFNPRKLGLLGCKHLQDNLYKAAIGAFYLGRFLADARVSRLDVAVDLTDVRPADLIVTTKRKEGQRAHYLGTDGALETVQVHRPSKTPGVGTIAAKLYDRNRERAAHGKSPPYPGREVTRLEIVKTRFPNGFGIADLPTMANPLAHVRLSYAPPLAKPGQGMSWQAYLAARHGVGHKAAVKALGGQPILGTFLRTRYEKHPSNLLSADAWNGWGNGLTASGFKYLVDMAVHGKGMEIND